jgi:hypothetical protein
MCRWTRRSQRVVVDFSGRPGLVMNVPFKSGMIGGFDSQLAHEFFQGFVNHAFVTLHIDNLQGRKRAPPVRDGVQGLCPRAAHGAGARPARGRHHSLDQGFAVGKNFWPARLLRNSYEK